MLGYHGFNLYVDAMELVLRGCFDTVQYLVRPIYDIGALMLIAWRDEALAADPRRGSEWSSSFERQVSRRKLSV